MTMMMMMMMMTSYNAMLQKLFTVPPIVSFMKVCKRTPQSEIPLTFHRRVGKGNGERRGKGGRDGLFFFFWGGREGGREERL